MLQRITIENFKSIEKVTVDLSPVTVFIGCSGVGKSNFLRAIRFLRNYLASPDEAIRIEGGWERIWPFGSPSPLSLRADFRLPGFEELFSYTVTWRPVQNSVAPRLDSEELSAAGKAIFSWKGQKWETWPNAGAAPGKTTPTAQLGAFPTLPEAVLAFTAWTSAVGWHDFPASVFTGHRATSDSAPANAIQGLGDSAQNFLAVVLAMTRDLRDQKSRRTVLARLKQINPSIRSVELDSVQKPTRIVVGHDVGGFSVPLDLAQESDGFRRYYAHLLALYQTPPKQLLMFEEPENGIYPGALRNLAEEFISASQTGRGQVLLSTQSPELLDGFECDQLRVVDIDPQTHTRIGRLDPDQADAIRTRLLHPGELLTVDTPRVAPVAAH
jgi:predicted ATPase